MLLVTMNNDDVLTKSFVIFIIELGIVYEPGTASVSSLSGIIESAAFKSNLKILGVKRACASSGEFIFDFDPF